MAKKQKKLVRAQQKKLVAAVAIAAAPEPLPLTWADHQAWERNWWGNCTNTFAEEVKQITYAHRMGLVIYKHPQLYETWPLYDMMGKSVVDIGGGPASMLLKCYRTREAVVIDPCDYPHWVRARYDAADIEWHRQPGEEPIDGTLFDEAWIYNTLQHVQAPFQVINVARRSAKIVRVFEWINRSTGIGHPHALTEQGLDDMLRGKGRTEELKGENGCHGWAYYGVFAGGVAP